MQSYTRRGRLENTYRKNEIKNWRCLFPSSKSTFDTVGMRDGCRPMGVLSLSLPTHNCNGNNKVAADCHTVFHAIAVPKVKAKIEFAFQSCVCSAPGRGAADCLLTFFQILWILILLIFCLFSSNSDECRQVAHAHRRAIQNIPNAPTTDRTIRIYVHLMSMVATKQLA